MVFRRMLKPLALSAVCLAFIALGQGGAAAAEVNIAGYTNGCFNCANPPNTSATQGDTLLGLTFTNATFNDTTANGFLAFGGNPTPPGVQGFNNLGSLTLSGAANSYNGNTFTLRVTFTAPAGIVGSNSPTFTTSLTGTVRSLPADCAPAAAPCGGVLLDFEDAPLTSCSPTPAGPARSPSGCWTSRSTQGRRANCAP